MNTHLLALPLLLSTLSSLAACAAQTAEEQAPAATARADVTAVQAKLDVFTRALVDRDVDAMRAVVSKEVLAQGVERGIDEATFLDKQRTALTNTLALKGDQRPAIEVTEVSEEGDAIRATLTYHGEALKKPFYFVREEGELKVNLAPPGFSKAAPDSALFGSSSYQVRNDMIPGNANLIVSCYQGKYSNGQWKPMTSVSVPASSSKSVSCADACGWWAGTIFSDGTNTRYCDWNAWGPDVILGVYGGPWVCADYC